MEDNRTPGAVLARELRAWRDKKGLTAQQLADRVTALGGKLTRQAISKIENLDRGVSIDELLLLGRGLGIPPILLIFPIGQVDEVEVLPGKSESTWAAMRWFTGEASFPRPPLVVESAEDIPAFIDDPEEGWEQGATPALLFREHAELVREWWAIPPQVRRLPLSDAEKTVVRDAQWAETVAKLRRVREEMKRHGLTPPPFPKDLEDER